jgi:hypothetical protein
MAKVVGMSAAGFLQGGESGLLRPEGPGAVLSFEDFEGGGNPGGDRGEPACPSREKETVDPRIEGISRLVDMSMTRQGDM